METSLASVLWRQQLERMPRDVLIEQILCNQERCEIRDGNLIFYLVSPEEDGIIFHRKSWWVTADAAKKIRRALRSNDTSDFSIDVCRCTVERKAGRLTLINKYNTKVIQPKHYETLIKWLESIDV